MRIFSKTFLAICVIGVVVGYGAAEWIVPKYFHPTPETTIKTQDIISVLGTAPKYYRQTTTGNYLASQYAQRHKDWEKASDFMGRVLQEERDDKDLKMHAMILAMAAGQVNHAISLARQVSEEDVHDNLLATLFIAADQFQTENYLEAGETLDQVDKNNLAGFIIPVLKLWSNAATGVFDLQTLGKQSFYAYHVLMAGKYLNKKAEAVEYAMAVFDPDETDSQHLEKIADAFFLSGKPNKANEIYQIILDRNFRTNDIVEKYDLLQNNQSIDHLIDIKTVKSPQEGAALVFLDMAEILLQQYSDDSATIFSRLALFLNPKLAEGHMIIGNVLTRYKRYEEAIEEYEMVDEEKSFHAVAKREIANLYAEQGDEKKAIEILETMYKEQEDIGALIQIGDIYRYMEDYKAAVKAYDRVIDLWEETPEKYWHVLYARGMAHERLKNYEESEDDLQKAIAFRPDHPFLLNYLGYSWADQGKNLNEALEMIEKAARLKPDDGYIADSLGWVYYKMGNYEDAIKHLERAVELLPYDATINDHLGDAYWQGERRLEARFQWRRAVNYSENDQAELKEKIELKLAHGLDVSPKDAEQSPLGTVTDVVKEAIEETVKPSL